MTRPVISLSALLARTVSEAAVADGRTARLCRDASGNYWVIDGDERIVSLARFATRGDLAAREFCALARAEMAGRLADRTKEVFARVAKAVHRMGAKVAHA